MKYLVVANWKMSPLSLKEAEILFTAVEKDIKKIPVDVVVCPPFIYLLQFLNPTGNLFLGAQNMHFEERGAYTGEISPLMLKSLNISYVILGHSERRYIFGETDETINKKIKQAIRSRIRPIFCVGEKYRSGLGEDNVYEKEIENQLVLGLKDVSNTRIADVILAYEPVWAIGSGTPASPDEVLKTSIFLRKTLAKLYGRPIASRIKILYGGSVTRKNAVDFVKEAKMDGLLVGGASLIAGEFVSLVKSIVESV